MKKPLFLKRSDKAPKQKEIQKARFRKFNWSLKNSLISLLLISLGLFGFSGWYWYNNIFADPDNLMSDMLDKSMNTPSVYRTVAQKSRQSNVEQTIYLSFSPQLATQSTTTLQEAGRVGEATSVVTETIGTTDKDFVRYTDIDIPKDDKPRDFNSVLNVWGKREKDDAKGEAVTFLNEALFSVIPFGNLPAEQRNVLLDQIKKDKVYTYKKAQKKLVDGRLVMLYDAEINTQKLVGVLAKYVEITGIGDASQLDPEQYKNAPALKLQLNIDVLNRHLKQVGFADSGRVESYHAYGMNREVKEPGTTIAIDELQGRLQKLQ